MYTISSNGFSHDQQVVDALDWLRINRVDVYTEIRKHFPENIIFPDKSAWIDYEAMGVDPEWSSWLCDAIEAEGEVTWIDGEPWVLEAEDMTVDTYEQDVN
jgi:hypothetical protein